MGQRLCSRLDAYALCHETGEESTGTARNTLKLEPGCRRSKVATAHQGQLAYGCLPVRRAPKRSRHHTATLSRGREPLGSPGRTGHGGQPLHRSCTRRRAAQLPGEGGRGYVIRRRYGVRRRARRSAPAALAGGGAAHRLRAYSDGSSLPRVRAATRRSLALTSTCFRDCAEKST